MHFSLKSALVLALAASGNLVAASGDIEARTATSMAPASSSVPIGIPIGGSTIALTQATTVGTLITQKAGHGHTGGVGHGQVPSSAASSKMHSHHKGAKAKATAASSSSGAAPTAVYVQALVAGGALGVAVLGAL